MIAQFSFDLFQRLGLYHTALDAASSKSIVAGTPKDIATLGTTLFEAQESALAFIALLRSGFFNHIAKLGKDERNLVRRIPAR